MESDLSYEDDDYDLQYSEDSASEPDVDLENQYYHSKIIKEENPKAALAAFQKVIDLQGENKGEWGFKALKQMVKINFKLKNYQEMLNKYREMLDYLKSTVTKNHGEKSINSVLDFTSTSKNIDLLQDFYETTLEMLKDSNNERLWFKTNTKLGKIYLERGEYHKTMNILKQLKKSCMTDDGEENMQKGTQLLEIYALEIQIFSAQKNNKQLKKLYERALRVPSAIPHPLIMSIIRECGGKMHLRSGDYEKAYTDFFLAFKNYDESGNPRRITCLKYLILTSMLMKSTINPIDSQEAKPYINDSEIVAMNNLITAYQRNDKKSFEKIFSENKETLVNDPFIRDHIEGLLQIVRTQGLLSLIKPYKIVRMSFIAKELNIEQDEAENLVVICILNGMINGRIDQVNQILVRQVDNVAGKIFNYNTADKMVVCIDKIINCVTSEFIA
ncbi:hypothetical protein Trydic_g19025 [Trypoxylus dichotomus]